MTDIEKRFITAQDLYRIVNVEDPQWSPDGTEVAFVRMDIDKAKNGYKRAIWRWRAEWGEARQFTNGGKADMQPRYSSDGSRMGFVSVRNGKPQVFLIRTDGGEARQLTSAPNGVGGFRWSPDGSQIVYTSALNAEERRLEKRGMFPPPPPADELDGKLAEVSREHKESVRYDPRVYTGLPFKAGTEFVSDRYSQVYLLEVDDKEAKPRRLTDEDTDFGLPTWSPDGKYLWSSAVRKARESRFEESDIVKITVEDGTIERLPREGHFAGTPKPSPDGKWIAGINFLDMQGFGHISRLTVAKPDGSGWRDLNLALDRSVTTTRFVSQYYWAPDSKGLYCLIDDHGESTIQYVDLATGEFTKVCGKNELILEFSVNKSGEITYVSRATERLPELFTTAAEGKRSKQCTDFNQAFLDEVIVAPTEAFTYQAPDGTKIQGWVVKPPDFDPAQKWPLAVNIHGGPHVMWSPATPAMWLEWQLHAARGYVVFFCNPRGSDGYGNEFRTAIHDNWGEADMADILSGVDHVVDQGFVDPKRMAVTGGSYGGFMTAWIVGHDRRFAAAVSQRGVYQLMSFYGTTDVPQLIEGEFDVMAFDDPEKMWKYSPFAYVRQMRTPLLLIHSDQDYRVPISDAEQLFTALKRLGRKVEFVRYPREGHELSRSGEPKHRIDRLERMTGWFDKYCKPRKVK